MAQKNIDKIVVVRKETELETLLKRYTTPSQVKFYLESMGESYSFYNDTHTLYQEGLKQVLNAIPKDMRKQVINRDYLTTFMFGEHDLIVSAGDDGLFVNVAKYAGTQPILSVNPNKEMGAGTLASCHIEKFPQLLNQAINNDTAIEKLTMAKARLENGEVMYALNDLFIGRKTHVSARYVIDYNLESERQASDGIIVSTGAGSTGWLKSIITGAYAISQGDQDMLQYIQFPSYAEYLKFAVMNPFPSQITGANIVQGEIMTKKPLTIVSNMPEQGVIFSDGIEEDYIEFTAGRTAVITPADKKAYLVK